MRLREACTLRDSASRSEAKAATDRAESDVTSRNSCVSSTPRLSGWNANGPWKWVVPQIVNVAVIVIASVAPRGPKRSADQISAGKAR